MPRAMCHPLYVYTPRSDEERHRLSLAHKRRLGIPDDCVRIYGIDVPQELANPLRNYASWVKQKRGLNAARAFIWTTLGRGKLRKPTRTKRRIHDRNYIYQPRAATIYRRIADLAAKKPLCEEGHLIYGVRVPSAYADVIKPHADRANDQGGRQSARWVICEAWDNGWPPMDPPGARQSIDLELVETLLLNYATIEEVAEFLGVSLPYLKSRLAKQRRSRE